MAKKDTVLSDVHPPSSSSHPADSVLNQGLFNDGRRVGSIEYIPDGEANLKLKLTNRKGNEIADL